MEHVYVYFLEVASIVATLLFLIDFLRVTQFPNTSTMVMRWILIISIAAASLNVLSLYLVEPTTYTPSILKWVVTTVFFLVEPALPFLIFTYVLCMCGRINRMKWYQFGLHAIPLLLYYILVLTNPITHVMFNIDAVGVFTQGDLYTTSYYALVASYLALCFVYMFVYRTKMSPAQCAVVWELLLIAVIITVVQLLNPNVVLIGFGFFLCIATIYFSLEKPGEYIDSETKHLNKRAYLVCAQRDIDLNRQFASIFVEVDNYGVVNELFGYNNGNELLISIVKSMDKLLHNCFVFRYDKESVMVVVEKQPYEHVVEIIEERFSRPWQVGDAEINLTATIIVTCYPQHFTTQLMQRKMLDYFYDKAKAMGAGTLLIPDEAMIKKFLRIRAVEDSLGRAIKENLLEVHYQPVHDAVTGKLFSAEALVRLYDDKLGYIPPVELIEVAEKRGSIVQLGRIVYEKVCEFVSRELQTKHLNLEYISVNLSAVQCLQPELANIFIEIVKQNKINPHFINLELTETALASSEGMVQKHMNDLKIFGVMFSCDDYGSGYSTCSYLINFPFTTVKFDRKMVSTYLENKTAQIIMDSELVALKNLGLKVVAEGVETEQQLQTMRDKGVDFIQGFYFSKPLSEEQFIKYCLEQQSK